MWCREFAAWLLLFALLPYQANALKQGERTGFTLRSPQARLQEAFRKLRVAFEKSHPDWTAEQERVSTQIRSVTPAPAVADENVLLQVHKKHRRHRQSPILNGTDDVIFSVWTDSNFYDTRLTGILNTWGKEIPAERFMAVSDKKRTNGCDKGSNVPGCHVEETQCPPHSHWEGACCKWAEGVIKAHERMKANPSLKWAFFSDDDIYLRPDAVATALHHQDRVKDPMKPQALGYFGCTTASGCGGLCGGGGFAINRAAVERLAGRDPVTFLNDEMAWCGKCERWADQAISMIWKDRGIEMQQLPGLNGWIMKEDDFKTQLVNGNPNLLFHYQKDINQMEALHEMFTGEKLLSHHDGPCWDYKGRQVCAASSNDADLPFIANKRK